MMEAHPSFRVRCGTVAPPEGPGQILRWPKRCLSMSIFGQDGRKEEGRNDRFPEGGVACDRVAALRPFESFLHHFQIWPFKPLSGEKSRSVLQFEMNVYLRQNSS